MTQDPSAGGDVVSAADFAFVLAEREVTFDVDEGIYPRAALYGAAFGFLDRCYVFLTRPADMRVRVRLRLAEAPAPEDRDEVLEALAGEFANELLNQVMRQRIGEATTQIRHSYIARAFASDATQTTIDELLDELDEEEMDDPLGIAVPWEERYAKR